MFSNGALAGTIISTNLPSNTWIVNIDGRNDGAAGYDSGQSSWFHPFAADGHLLELTLPAGTYRFSVIDGTDAHAQFSGLTSGQLSTISGAWSYNSPFTTSYFVFDQSAASDPTQPQLFAGANQGAVGGNYTFYNANDAYQATKAAGQLDQLFTGPGGRVHGVEARSYTLTATETLVFAVPDNGLGDNQGSVSVAVQAVPEPMTLGALGVGLLAVGRRRRPATRA